MSQSQKDLNQTLEIPEKLPVLLLPGQVMFPVSLAPMQITGDPARELIDAVAANDRLLGVVGQSEGEAPDVEKAAHVGVVARLLQLQRTDDDNRNIVVQAFRRFSVLEFTQTDPYPVARIMLLEESYQETDESKALVESIKQQMSHLIDVSPRIPDEAKGVLQNIQSAGALADIVAANLNLSFDEGVKLLETLDATERLKRLTSLVAREVQISEVAQKIQSDAKSTIDKAQREFYLRQQLNAIKQELGETSEEGSRIAEYREKIEALDAPEEVRKEALRQVDRLSSMNEASAEYHVIENYLDWIVELPWNVYTEDRLDISRAEAILNEDHYGLEDVKKRILEYLAVRKLRPDAAGPILCFVGPPGVGKTSLGRSIARALGREFTRISLGGIRDEAEIRGHRTTYVGAQPGRIIQSIRKVESSNPVFMLDEIDKVGADFRGDPSSALLEVLDPAQNFSFSDHFLNVPFDLSRVMFIATANILDTIPWALRDRMEVIEISGYTIEEKLHIAREYLVPRQIEAHGLPKSKVKFSDAVLRKIADSYTREAGVRNLERGIATVCRRCARQFAEGRKAKISITLENLRDYLGNERYYNEVVERMKVPGVATGLAWTPTGGGIMFVEATCMPGKGELVLTGQLGNVMKESAQAALSYLRSNADRLDIDSKWVSEQDVHIHVPAGAVPKDGPSAGVAMLTALASLIKGVKVKDRMAMTGEITLRGQVLPVGGVKEKVLAAARAGIREVILPELCKKDLDDVPDVAKEKLRFHYVSRMEQVLEIALGIRM